MALVFIPTMLQPLTGGVSQVRVAGRTIRSIINQLEERFPGIKERLLQDGDLRPDVAVAIDGETALDGIGSRYYHHRPRKWPRHHQMDRAI